MSDTGTLARLQVQLEAKLDKFESSLSKAEQRVKAFQGNVETNLHHADDAFANLFGHADPGKAIENVFGRSRFALIEEGAVKIPVLGHALEELGVAGLGAAAAVAGLFVTMERAEKAVEYGAEMAKTAKTVGVATDFIQEFNFAARQSEVDVGQADQSLKALNASLGLVQSGLARKQLTNAFKALGFSPEDLRQFKDVGELFPVLAERMEKLGNAAEQAAIAKRLGIEELLPMLKEGENNFNALAQKAQDLGIVMSASLIEKSEEAKRKMTELDDVMKAKANITFAEFAQTIIAVKSAFLEAESAALKFLGAITGTRSARAELETINQSIARIYADNPNGLGFHEQNRLDHLVRRAVELQPRVLEEMKTDAEGAHGPETPPAKQLVDGTAKKKDETQAKIQESLKQEADAHGKLLAALLAETTSLQDQLSIEQQIAQAERDKINAEYDKRIQEVKTSDSIKAAAKKQIEANLEKARTDELAAVSAKEIKKQVDLQLTHEKARVQNLIKLDDVEATILEGQAQLATTLKERTALERAALNKRQSAERDQARLALVEAFSKGDLTAIGNASADYDATLRRQGGQNAVFDKAHQGPIKDYLDRVQDLDTEFQIAGVRAVDSFSTGLADALVNAKNFGQVVSGVFRQLIADVLSAAIRKTVMTALGLPGFAGGTDFAPGGMALVGENGPELVNLPRGSQVVPNHSLANAVRGGAVVNQHFYLQGAVTTDELMARVDGLATQRAMQAGAAAKADAVRTVRVASANRLGR